MRCPFCSYSSTLVRDSRPTENNTEVRRRRSCPKCKSRFTTFERVQLREIIVLKKNGELRPFHREKLLKSIGIASRKRPVTQEQIEKLVSEIIRNLEASGDNIIPSVRIGEEVMQSLAKLDVVSYVRYASVYKDFRDVSDFKEFVGSISAKKFEDA